MSTTPNINEILENLKQIIKAKIKKKKEFPLLGEDASDTDIKQWTESIKELNKVTEIFKQLKKGGRKKRGRNTRGRNTRGRNTRGRKKHKIKKRGRKTRKK
jgi:hypothetical protein